CRAAWELFRTEAGLRRAVNMKTDSVPDLSAEPARPDLPPPPSPEQIDELLARLDELSRKLLQVRFLEGKTLSETAREVGLKRTTADRLIREALGLLRGPARDMGLGPS